MPAKSKKPSKVTVGKVAKATKPSKIKKPKGFGNLGKMKKPADSAGM